MKKLNLLFALFLLSAFGLQAQFDLGLRFQTGIQNQRSESIFLISPGRSVDYKLTLNEISNTQSVGVYSQFNFGWLYLQPEVLYTKYDVVYSVEDFKAEVLEKKQYLEKYQQFDLPINAGLRYKNFRLGGGPVFHFVQDLDSDLLELRNIEFNKKQVTAGFQAGIGFDWKIVHFDIKYQRDFNSVNDHVSYGAAPSTLKATPSSIQFGMALALGAKNKSR